MRNDHPLDTAPIEGAALRVISLGAGVQSSVMALMGARGAFGPIPDAAIFADTQWEPAAVYAHLAWLETELPFPVFRVTAGSLHENLLSHVNSTGQRFVSVPAYIRNGDGSQGIQRRQCTREHKIDPIQRKVRELLGLTPGQRNPDARFAEQWIGISLDELQRVRDTDTSYQINRWPLVGARMSRRDCVAWFAENYPGRTLPRSACLGCPYKSDGEWRRLRDEDPAGFENACAVDAAIRFQTGLCGAAYLHRSLKPLREVDLSTAEDNGQSSFLGECEGMCGA